MPTTLDLLLANPLADPLIGKFYPAEPELRQLLLTHSMCVAQKAIRIAESLKSCRPDVEPDMLFIARAALLHDIGIANCDAPDIHCHGQLPYICHGVEGARMLAEEGLFAYARVCERHTGSGLTADNIADQGLPLPQRDMLPETLEEKIICYADKFFSKNPDSLTSEKSLQSIRRSMLAHGEDALARFDSLTRQLTCGPENPDDSAT
ncbi:MAG: HD domain-containing protein [Muribaculaceae bacterium]|nr:HD domain-containing protein [Muribaculaceae bacterium]MDE5924601.1 HD domain-containing protein [Muribaculaceae bacterium]